MGFLDPKKQDDQDDALPGAPGLHLELDLLRCPSCQREVPPWQRTCPDCGVAAVPPGELQAPSFALPNLPDDPDERGNEVPGADEEE